MTQTQNVFNSRGHLSGLGTPSSGKVRDTYDLGNGRLLVVATNRISVFDFVLNAAVPFKGEILTAMNVFWCQKFPKYRHDIVAYGAAIDQHLPEHLRNKPELQRRAIVVKRLEMIPIEAIMRGYLTGSGLKAYTTDGKVCGHILPEGLHDGSRLPKPIFTPTTKAKIGHDEHIDAKIVNARYGTSVEDLAKAFFNDASTYALTRGYIIADTKFEFGLLDGFLTIGDERVTPDSSRFWKLTEWQIAVAKGKSPQSYDKQFVRDYCKTLGIDKKDPTKPEDYAWVRAQVIDPQCLAQTSQIYQNIFTDLVGLNRQQFHQQVMNISEE